MLERRPTVSQEQRDLALRRGLCKFPIRYCRRHARVIRDARHVPRTPCTFVGPLRTRNGFWHVICSPATDASRWRRRRICRNAPASWRQRRHAPACPSELFLQDGIAVVRPNCSHQQERQPQPVFQIELLDICFHSSNSSPRFFWWRCGYLAFCASFYI